MAKKKKLNPVKEIEIKSENQVTTPGLSVYAGVIEDTDYSQLSWSERIEYYMKMRDSDSIASTTIDVLKLPILRSNYRIDLPDDASETAKQMQSYIKYTIDNIYKGFDYFKRHALNALDFGLSIFEMVWNRGETWEGKTVNQLVKISPIKLNTIEKFNFTSQGDFIGIQQERKDNKTALVTKIDVSVDSLFYFSHNEEYGDPRGRSMLRPVIKPFIYKEKIMANDAMAAANGRGIPKIMLGEDVGQTDPMFGYAKTIGRYIANGQNTYFVGQKGAKGADFNLVSLEGNQDKNIDRLHYYDSQMFYNSMTEFMFSGIGQSGSRSATGEHKSIYERQAGAIQYEFDNAINTMLIPAIIANSWTNELDKSDIPVFHSEAPSEMDIHVIVDDMVKLANINGLTIDSEIQNWIRGEINLPPISPEKLKQMQDAEKKSIEEPEPKPNDIPGDIKPDTELEHNHNHISLEYRTPNENESKIFSLESAKEFYDTDLEKAKEDLAETYQKIIDDMAKQVQANPKKKPELKYRTSLEQKMIKYFKNGLRRGRNDAQRELAKSRGIELQAPIKRAENYKVLTVIIDALYSGIEKSLLERLQNTNENAINQSGGYEKWVHENYDDSQKLNRGQILTYTESSYFKGRMEELIAENNRGDQYQYTAIMDVNACQNCAPLNEIVHSLETWESMGLNVNTGAQMLNPECLGLTRCRCQLIPLGQPRR